MLYRPLAVLKVPLFASLLIGAAHSFPAAAAPAQSELSLRPNSLFVFTEDRELDTPEGTISFIFRGHHSLWSNSSKVACFFVAEKGMTSMVESGTAWRLMQSPREGWNDDLAYLSSVSDSRQLLMICRKEHDEKIPLALLISTFAKSGIAITPAP